MMTVGSVNAQESPLDVMDGGHGIYTAVCMSVSASEDVCFIYICIPFAESAPS